VRIRGADRSCPRGEPGSAAGDIHHRAGGRAAGGGIGHCGPHRRMVTAYGGTAAAVGRCRAGVTVLYFCIPSPRHRADLVDGEVRGCRDPRALRDGTVARLNEAEARRPDAHSQKWDEQFDQAIVQRPGVVLQVHVLRGRQIFEKRAVWNRGKLTAGPWTATDRDAEYFAEASEATCSGHVASTRAQWSVSGNTGIWRPQGIAEILGLKVAEPASKRYSQFAGNP